MPDRSRQPGRGCGGGNMPEVILPCLACGQNSDPSNNEYCHSCKTRIGDGVVFIETLDAINLIPNRAVVLDKLSSIKVLNFILTKEEDRNTALKTQKCWLSESVFNVLFNFVFMTPTNNKIQ